MADFKRPLGSTLMDTSIPEGSMRLEETGDFPLMLWCPAFKSDRVLPALITEIERFSGKGRSNGWGVQCINTMLCALYHWHLSNSM